MADKTVGSNGGLRDYTTCAGLASFLSSLTISAPYVVEFYNDGAAITDTAQVTFGGWTGGNSTNTMTFRPATGQGFKDTQPNALRWNSSIGAACTNSVNSGFGAYKFTGGNFIVDGLQFKGTDTSTTSVFQTATGASQVFKNLVMQSEGTSPLFYVNSNHPTLQNIAAVVHGDSAGLRVESSNGECDGCTFVKNGSSTKVGISQAHAGSFTVKNTAFYGFNADSSATGSYNAGSTNNATTASTFVVSSLRGSQVANITSAAFTSVSAGSEDLRIGSSSVLKDAGATAGLATDIMGTSRPSGSAYDIGPYEYVAAVPPTTDTLTGPTSGTTGVASSNFTITLDHPATGTITFTPAGTVGTNTFTPSSPQITAGNSTVTFTDTAAIDGTHVVTVTNNGGLSDVGSINYVTTTGGGAADPAAKSTRQPLTGRTSYGVTR